MYFDTVTARCIVCFKRGKRTIDSRFNYQWDQHELLTICNRCLLYYIPEKRLLEEALKFYKDGGSRHD